MSGDGTTRVEIEGERYQLRPWSVPHGNEWWFELSAALVGIIGSGKIRIEGGQAQLSEASALTQFVHVMPIAKLLELGKVCVEYTDIIGSHQGAETVQPLDRFPLHLQGKQDVLTVLMIEHVRWQFGGPFSRLMRRLGAGRVANGKDQSTSQSPPA